MKKPKKIAAVLALMTAAQAYAFDLKGVQLGDSMNECPAEATVLPARTAETLCTFGATTLANQPATDHLMSFYDGKIITIMYKMAAKGRSANIDLFNALREKFGPPTSSKPHVNEYQWHKNGQLLSLDGYTGLLVLMDLNAVKATREQAAKKNKADL